MARSRSIAVLELVFCTLIWSVAFAVTKEAGREVTPMVAILMRIVLALPLLGAAAAMTGRLALPSARDLPGLALLALLGIIILQDLQFLAMKSAGVANANWIVAAEPVITALLAHIFLGEKFGSIGYAGLAIAIVGVLLVVGLGTKGLGLFSVGGMSDVILMGTAVDWCVFQTLGRAIARRRPGASLSVFWMFVLALPMQAAIVAATGEDVAQLASISPGAWGSLLYLGCLSSGLCYMMWYDGLAVMPAASVAAFLFLQPVFGTAAGYIIEGERFTPYAALGGALVIAGVVMVSIGRGRRAG